MTSVGPGSLQGGLPHFGSSVDQVDNTKQILGANVDFERTYDASTERVIGALVSEVKDVGQMLGVGEYGTEVAFKIADSTFQPAPILLARVGGDGGVTVLRVSESLNGEWRSLKDDHHLLHLTELLDRVSKRLVTSP